MAVFTHCFSTLHKICLQTVVYAEYFSLRPFKIMCVNLLSERKERCGVLMKLKGS